MKKLTVLIFSLVAFTLHAQTADEIFDKFYAATGGKSLWEGISTYKVNQSFKANAPTDYDVELNVSTANNSISKRKTILQKDFFYVANGNEAWLKIPLGGSDKKVKYDVKDLSEKDKKALIQEATDYPIVFLNYDKKGYTATFAGVEGTSNRVVMEGNGSKYDLYFDTTTNLLTKSVETKATETVTIEHKNYEKSKYGVSYPAESSYMSSKDKKKINLTTDMTFNETLEAVLFVR